MTIHIYRAKDQKATRYRVQLGDHVLVVKNPPNRLFHCFKCKKKRPAKNLIIHVYYDGSYYFCVKGKGCKAP